MGCALLEQMGSLCGGIQQSRSPALEPGVLSPATRQVQQLCHPLRSTLQSQGGGNSKSLIPPMSVKAAEVFLLHCTIPASVISFCCCVPVDQEPRVLGAMQMQNVSIHHKNQQVLSTQTRLSTETESFHL